MTRPGLVVGTYDYVADTRYSWGGIAFPFAGGSKTFGVQLGTFGFKDQPVYTVEQPDGTGATYSVNETFVGLTYAQNFSDRFSAGITAKFISRQPGRRQRQGLRGGLRHQLPRGAERPPGEVLVRAVQPGHRTSGYSGNALNTGVRA